MAVAVVLVLVAGGSVAGVDEDADLRRLIRSAGLTPYWSFRPPAPFRYPDITGGPAITLDAFKGQVVLVNLWATWCSACATEMVGLQALHDRYQQQGLAVVGINIVDRTNTAALVEWLQARGLTYPNARATDREPQFPSRHDIPQTFLIDRRGRLLAQKAGEWDWTSERVRALLVHLLTTPPR